VLAQPAVGSVLGLCGAIHRCTVLASSLLGKSFGSSFHAAACWLAIVSALIPIAQMNPSNSRATAVMIFPWGLPAAPSFIYRLGRCKVGDDSSMRLRRRFVAGARCRF
jgi:hypothetical protein